MTTVVQLQLCIYLGRAPSHNEGGSADFVKCPDFWNLSASRNWSSYFAITYLCYLYYFICLPVCSIIITNIHKCSYDLNLLILEFWPQQWQVKLKRDPRKMPLNKIILYTTIYRDGNISVHLTAVVMGGPSKNCFSFNLVPQQFSLNGLAALQDDLAIPTWWTKSHERINLYVKRWLPGFQFHQASMILLEPVLLSITVDCPLEGARSIQLLKPH